MKVALITMRPKIADKKANLEKMEKYIKKTKADIYVFGELTVCGYHVKDELKDIAEPVNGSININLLRRFAYSVSLNSLYPFCSANAFNLDICVNSF